MRLYEAKLLCLQIKKSIIQANERRDYMRVRKLKEAKRRIRLKIADFEHA